VAWVCAPLMSSVLLASMVRALVPEPARTKVYCRPTQTAAAGRVMLKAPAWVSPRMTPSRSDTPSVTAADTVLSRRGLDTPLMSVRTDRSPLTLALVA
jgi:hypothetical protein